MNSMKPRNINLALLAGLGLLAANQSQVQAQSADALIDKLVEKGILNTREAQELRDESDKGFATAHAVKTGMPDWVSSLKMNGDFRGRFDGTYSDNVTSVDRNRFRYRLRFGVTANIVDDFEVGFRLGSGDLDGAAAALGSGVDPISQNQSFQNNGSKKGIFLDLAYGKWSPLHTPDWNGSFSFGKIENPFVASDLVFDNDYTPEGGAIALSYNLSPKHQIKWNTGGFVLDEIGGNSQDPYMMGTQLRLDSVWNPEISSSVGITAMTIAGERNLKNTDVPNINRGNTRDANGALLNAYNPIYADASVTYMRVSFPMYVGPFPIKFSGEYLVNPAAHLDNDGYSGGVMFGKSGRKGLWDVSYTYKVLGADAWYEEFADSDTGAFYQAAYPNSGAGAGYGPGTNLRGHTVKFAYSPYDSLTLSAKWFMIEANNETPAGSNSMNHRLQLDAVWKF